MGKYSTFIVAVCVYIRLIISALVAVCPLVLQAQTTEICNNGIDDDGDKLIDCQDPDCPECDRFQSCVQPNTCYMPPIWGVPNSTGSSVYGSQDLVLSTSAPFTTVTIRSADGTYTNTVAVTSTGSTIVSLPLSVVLSNQVNTKELNKGLIITSGEPVQVTYRLTPGLNQDIVPLKCRAALGYAFYAGSQTRLTTTNVPDERHFVSVMATLDGTTVTFRSPIDLEGHPANVPFTITLNAGQTYLVASRLINSGANSENKSVAGTLITSDPDHPIVVNSGSQHTAQPYSGNRDAGIDQLVPARTAGTDYVAVHSLNTTANSDYVFVVAIENNTTVTISGPTTTAGTSSVLSTTTLQAGQVYTYNLPNAAQNRAFYIKTSRKAYTYHVSSYAQNEFGMGMLPTINPCNGSKRIDFYRTTSASNDQALVTIPSSGTASLTFRGQPFLVYGSVIDRITINGVPHSIISFPNSSIAAVDNVNTLISTERFHVGVVSNTGGASTGNYGYYSNYEARVDVINATSGQPDDFITVAQVTVGSPVDYCLTLTSCGNTNTIKNIIPGKYTRSATFNNQQCVTYTMSTTAPICARDTIRVIVQNELGREGQVCLEYVNNNNDLIVSVLSSSSAICQPAGTVSLTVVPISSGGNYQYQWITPDKQVLTTKIIQAAVPGRYLISVSDGNTCTDTSSIVLLADTPSVKFTGTSAGSTSFCAGATVPYTMSATTGTYAWSITNGTILSGGTPTSLSATVRWGSAGTGTLRVRVTSANGCTALVTQTVALQAAPTLSFSVQNAACNGQATGLINLTPSGGTTPYSYSWTGPTGNSFLTEDLTNVAVGVYSVTVTDRGGCVASGSATVGQATIISVSGSVTNVVCNSRSTGAISLSVSGGTPVYRYSWSIGGSTLPATTPTLTGLSAGTYVATVMDANNCTNSLTVVVTQPPAITLNLTQQNVACNGAATGSINLTPTGGTGTYSYKWTTGFTTEDIAGLVAGTYSVTVTDANGCTATTSATIQEPTALVVSTTRINPACNGATSGSIDLTVSGGTAAYSYQWTNGATTQDISGLVAGAYSVTVTDANTCKAVTSVTLTQPATLILNASQQHAGCFGGNTGSINLSPTGGTGTYSYKWTTGAQTQNLVALPAGTYSVTVTDASQCSVVQPFSVTQPAALALTAVRQHIACNGANTGGIDLTVSGGTAPFAYIWTGPTGNNALTQDITSVAAGTYTVTVTDANNCVASQTFSLTQPATLLANLTKQNAACNGAATGSISLAPTGGTGVYTYLWQDGVQTQNRSTLPAGSYSVVVTDANGCTATASAILTQPTALTLTSTHVNPACFGAGNGSIDLTVSGGTAAYSYLWNAGAQTQDVASLPAGPYSVTVTDANGCRATLAATLTNPPALSLAVSPRNPACFGSATGSVSLTASGGTGAYTYRWTTGGTTASISGLVAGAYSVTVTDANACSLIRSVTLTNPPALTLAALAQNPACFGVATGSLNLTVTGGTPAYTYLWDTGATTQNLTGITAGTYRVTVTDANGCSQTLTATLTNPPALSVVLAPAPVACNGASTGLVSLTASGGTGAYTYKWNTGASSQNLASLPAGAYSVTVTDANGCVAKALATLQQPAALTVTMAPQPVSCFAGTDGQIGLTVQGGTGSYTYLWTGPTSNGASTSALSGISAGTYSVTVTDASACKATATATVLQPTALSLTATVQHPACFDGQTGQINVSPSGGTAPYTFAWSDGSTTKDLTGIMAGTYSLTMTDANGCTITLSRSLTQPSAVGATASFTNVNCTNGANGRIDLTPSGGVLPYTYLWSNGATTQDISGLTSNTYVVTITDANGCSFNYAVPIIQPRPLTVQPDPSIVLCNGQLASIVTDVRGGTQPFSYSWNNGATTASVYNLPAGTYSLTVTDANSCTATTQATIDQPPPFGINAIVTPVACNAGSTGSIILNVEGATPPYAYTVKSPAGTVVTNTSVATGLSAGTYSVTITDALNCTQAVDITIQEPPVVTLTTAVTNISCFGTPTGTISLSAIGGRQPYAYSWQDGVTTQQRPDVGAGSYTVVVTDANSCTSTATASLTQPPQLSVGGSFTDVSCFGGNNGAIMAFPVGGTLPYSYSWTTGAQTQQVAALQAGIYSVTVTDAHGCVDELRVTVEQPTALSVTAFPENLTCFQNASGRVDLAVAGGTLPYSYSWNTGAQTQQVASLQAGVYSVTVTDGNGCSEIRSVTLTQPDVLTLTGTTQNLVCFGNATGSINLTITGGTGIKAVRWNDGSTLQNRTGLLAGIYSVSITDGNECGVGQSFTITQPPALTSAVTSQSIACFAGTTGSISLTATGGTSPYSYSWNDGFTTQNRTGLAAGNYLVVITDGNGCQTSNGAIINQPTPLVLALTPTPARCFGSADGNVAASLQGGTPAYSYSWNTGTTTSTITGLIAGTYSVTATDANGCTATAQATVNQPTALTVTGTQTDILCNSSTTGQANVVASGGTTGYTYLWAGPANAGATTSSITNLPAGVYSVTVTDANGCFQIHSFTLTQPTAVSVAVSGTNISCFRGTTGAVSLTASGGVPGYTYLWTGPRSMGVTTVSIDNIPAGVYSVTATDANGCSAQNSLTLTQPAALTGRMAGTGITCFGGTDGTISTTVGGGTSPYTYDWLDMVKPASSRTGLRIGTYLVNVTDSQGCELTLIQSLTQPTSVVFAQLADPARCFGSTDGMVSVTALGGTPASGPAGYSYVWAGPTVTGSTLQSLTGLGTGTYSVTATDGNGCTATTSAFVDQPTSLSLTGITDDILCFGGNNGRITLNVSGGTPAPTGQPYSYSWSNGVETQNLVTLQAGVYSVTVTDAHDCFLIQSFTLTQPPALSLTTTTQNIACFGGTTGLASVTASGGNPMAGLSPYAFKWNTGAVTAAIQTMPAGMYSVTATDANQCTAVTSVTLTQPTALSIDASTTPITCFGGSDGTMSLTVTGGVTPYSYTWTDGVTLADRTSLTVGAYQVAVTDANGCQIAIMRTLTQPDLLRLQTSSAAVSCFGGTDGIVSVNAVGGTPGPASQPYTYLWAGPMGNGASTSAVTGLVAGTYSVTVTDANGCSQTSSQTISEPTVLSVTGLPTPASCAGGKDGAVSVTATGGTPLYGYRWAGPIAGPMGNSATTSDQTGLVAGLYSVTVTDRNGCSTLLSLSVTEPPQLTITLSQQNNRCEGDQTGHAEALVTGGTGPYSYTWTDANQVILSSTSQLNNVPVGSYTLVVADAQACRDTVSITLTEPLRLAAQTSLTHVSCFGGTDGAISTTLAGGTFPYSYTWTTSSLGPLPSTPTQSSLVTDAYVLKVSDANGCRIEFVLSIGQPDALSLVNLTTPVRCYSGADGVLSVTATGGTAPYSYAWANSAGTLVGSTSVVSGLAAGVYSVTLTDAQRCSLSQSYTVTEPTALSLTGTSATVACFSGNDGAVSLTVTGGTPLTLNQPYSYTWSTGAETQNLASLQTGIYSVTATDTNGCTIGGSFSVGQSTSLTLAATVSPVHCFSGNDGAISLTVTGGTSLTTGQPYLYTWAGPMAGSINGQSTSAISGLIAGTYSVTIADGNGCQSVDSFTVSQPTALSINGLATAVSCFSGLNGTASLTVAGGISPYTYLWQKDGAAFPGSTSVLTGLAVGVYSATVTDANDCRVGLSLTVTEPTALTVAGTATAVSCFSGTDGTVSLTVSGGTTSLSKSYAYTWSNPSGTFVVSTSALTGLVADVYSVTVTDANGCTRTDAFTITQPVGLSLTATVSPVRCFSGIDGAISLTVTGGTPNPAGQAYSYTWTRPISTGQSTSVVSGLAAGTYSVTIADGNGCMLAQSFTVTEPTVLSLTAQTRPVTCNAGTDGSISLTVVGGTSGPPNQPYSYSWTGSIGSGPATSSVSGLAAGTYSVTITDANACTLTQSFTVTEPTALSLTSAITDVRCFSGTDGLLSLTVAGGTPGLSNQPYSYSWASGQSTSLVAGLAAGTYSVTVTDANTCAAVLSLTVNQPSALSLTGIAPAVACFSGNDGAVSLTVTGGTMPYSYSWSTGAETNDLASLPAGIYSVTATDANGCTIGGSFSVGQSSSLSVVATVSSVACFSGNDGAISLTVTGGTSATTSQPYAYTWAGPMAGTINGQSTSAISGLIAGTYSVTIADGNGCQSVDSFTVSQPTALSLNNAVRNVSCHDGIDGSVSLTITGGRPGMIDQPYAYSWTGGQSASAINGLAAGTYSVTATDGNACTLTQSFTISQPTALSLTGSVTNVRCFSGTDGMASLTVSGGTPGPAQSYTYLWSGPATGPMGNGASTSAVTGLVAGTYAVTVVDANGCAAGLSLTVNEPTALSMVPRQTNVNCAGGSDGTISLTVSGGTAATGTSPYSYAWANRDGGPGANLVIVSTSAVSGLGAGAYSVTVTDGNGCVLTNRFVVSQPAPLLVSALPTSVSCAGQPATVTTEVRGGTGPYSYSWSNGTTNLTVLNLPAGTYSLTVTDANGCTATTPVSVSQPPAFALNAIVKPVRCNGGNTGSIDVTVEGATPAYSYSWSNGVATQDLQSLPAGTYSLTVTDANGCQEVVSFTLTQADGLTLAGQAVTPNCAGSEPRQDGQLLLTTFDPTWRYAISEGGSFTAVVVDPGTLPVIPANGLLRNDLPSPGTALGQPYTIRIFTTQGCSKDLTLTLLPAACVCKPDICPPVRIRKTKGL